MKKSFSELVKVHKKQGHTKIPIKEIGKWASEEYIYWIKRGRNYENRYKFNSAEECFGRARILLDIARDCIKVDKFQKFTKLLMLRGEKEK